MAGVKVFLYIWMIRPLPLRPKRCVAWLLRILNTSHTRYTYFNYTSLIRYKYLLRRCTFFSLRSLIYEASGAMVIFLSDTCRRSQFRFSVQQFRYSTNYWCGRGQTEDSKSTSQLHLKLCHKYLCFSWTEINVKLKVMAEQTRCSVVFCKHKIFNEGLSISQCWGYWKFYIDVTFTSHNHHHLSSSTPHFSFSKL